MEWEKHKNPKSSVKTTTTAQAAARLPALESLGSVSSLGSVLDIVNPVDQNDDSLSVSTLGSVLDLVNSRKSTSSCSVSSSFGRVLDPANQPCSSNALRQHPFHRSLPAPTPTASNIPPNSFSGALVAPNVSWLPQKSTKQDKVSKPTRATEDHADEQTARQNCQRSSEQRQQDNDHHQRQQYVQMKAQSRSDWANNMASVNRQNEMQDERRRQERETAHGQYISDIQRQINEQIQKERSEQAQDRTWRPFLAEPNRTHKKIYYDASYYDSVKALEETSSMRASAKIQEENNHSESNQQASEGILQTEAVEHLQLSGVVKKSRKQTFVQAVKRGIDQLQAFVTTQNSEDASRTCTDEIVIQVPERSLRADFEPSSTFVLDGKPVDLTCFNEGQELPQVVADIYMNILKIKFSNELDQSKIVLYCSSSIFSDTNKLKFFSDGTFSVGKDRTCEVSQNFIDALLEAEDSIVGLVSTAHRTIPYVATRSKREILILHPQDDAVPLAGFEKMRSLISSRVANEPWTVNFSKYHYLPHDQTQDSAVCALFAVETYIRGRTSLPGVSSISDYRQKLKWSVINDASSCLKATDCDRKAITAAANQKLQEIIHRSSKATNVKDFLQTSNTFDKVGSKIVCRKCIGTKSFKPISASENETSEEWPKTKAAMLAHMKLASHQSRFGINIIEKSTGAETSKRHIESVEDLFEHFPWVELADDEKLTCKSCNGSSKGTFKLPAVSTSLHRWSDLKRTLLAHSQLESHISQFNKTTTAENRSIGLNNGQSAYMCLKNGLGLNQYERIVNLDQTKNVPVGELNHSKGFVSEMRKNAAEVLREKLRNQLHRTLDSTGRSPKCSVLGDKYSVLGNSYHIIGGVTHYGGKLKSYLFDALESSGGDAESLANDLHRSLTKQFEQEELKSAVIASCFDGQYHQYNVPRRLMDRMGISHSARNAYSTQWDHGHLLELAASSARGQTKDIDTIQTEWVKDALQICRDFESSFRYGKQLKQLKELAVLMRDENEDLNPLKRMKTYSSTRFASHLASFISTLDDNFVYLYEYLESQADPRLAQLRDPSFVLRMSALADIYGFVGEASRELQKVHKMPWHGKAIVKNLKCRLEKVMGTDLSVEIPRFDPEVLTKLGSCVSEMLLYETYKGKELTFERKRPRRNSEKFERPAVTIIVAEAENVISHAKSLLDNIEDRFFQKSEKVLNDKRIKRARKNLEDNSRKKAAELFGSEALDLIEKVFSIEELSTRNFSMATEMGQLFDLYKTSELLLPEDKLETIQQEYEAFKDEVVKCVSAGFSREDESNFYIGLLDGGRNSFPLISEMISLSVVRNATETVIESIGSQIAQIVNGRGKLSVDSVNDEVTIRHNGPPAGPQSQRLVEQALDKKFKGKPWKFLRTSADKNELKNVCVSKVVDRQRIEDPKINID